MPIAGPNITSAVRTTTTTDDVTWAPLSNLTVTRGFVISYTVRYRPKSSQSENCAASNVSSWAAGDGVTIVTMNASISTTGLDPNSGYCVAVAATTRAGTGPYSTPATIESKSALFILYGLTALS